MYDDWLHCSSFKGETVLASLQLLQEKLAPGFWARQSSFFFVLFSTLIDGLLPGRIQKALLLRKLLEIHHPIFWTASLALNHMCQHSAFDQVVWCPGYRKFLCGHRNILFSWGLSLWQMESFYLLFAGYYFWRVADAATLHVGFKALRAMSRGAI